ncbi:MAG: SDR family oxidoreductase [Nitratireductor sp.]|nr:SDR family oxidoreductase [Nitratireductor sp.]MCB1456609.1 SDR family oxidoreductase [Nitratireductor sp.]MCB1459056.1 SDR family oxidoreductase [Nitratireductor sp.]
MSRSILVTGCSSGIGRHCAIRLKEEGWRVFATARKESDLADLAGLGLDPVHLEHCDGNSISRAVETVLDATGGVLDALFNNAAHGQPGAIEDLPVEVLREQFEANLFGPHQLVRLLLPAMRRQGHGRIVHCSSILGIVPYRWRGAYNASKHALEGLFLTQRLELMGTGIHVSLIEPGPIVSRFGDNALAKARANIDIENSVHREIYHKHLAKLESGGGVNRFRLGPEAVYRKLVHALNSEKPRAQYPVTIPALVLLNIRSVAPQWLMDRILMGND